MGPLLARVRFDIEPDKVLARTPEPVLLNRVSSSSSFPFSAAARSCKVLWCCHASVKHLGEQW